MPIDVGDITGGLTVDTSGLEKALSKLSQFSDEVNKWADKTEKGAQRVANALAKQERAAGSVISKTDQMHALMRRSEAPTEMMGQATKQAQAFVKVMTSGELSAIEFGRAMTQITAQLGKIAQAIKDVEKAKKDQQRQDSMMQKRDLELMRLRAQEQSIMEKRDMDMQRIRAMRQEVNQRRDIELMRMKGAESEMLQRRDMEMNNVRARMNEIVQKRDVELSRLAAQEREVHQKRDLEMARIRGQQNEIFQRRDMELNKMRASESAVNQKRDLEMMRVRSSEQERLERRDMQAQQMRWAQERQIEAQRRKDQAIRERRDEQLHLMRGGSLSPFTIPGSPEEKIGKMAEAMRALERATLLAAGPLSGVGYRVSVLANLMESGAAKATLFVAGLTGVAAGFYMLTSAGVRASMQMEKFNALLTASSGASVLAGQEFEYVMNVANRFGQNVTDITPSFAKFGAAARLSGVSAEQTRKTFEGVVTAASGLRLTGEQTGRMFLALEQIMSKGVVQSQEIKQQLGDVLPGALQLASKAMGVTTSKFIDMMEKGEVLSKNFIGPFTELLTKTFSAAAEQGAESLQGQLARLQNKTFEFLTTMDTATGVSKAFANVVKLLGNAIEGLTANISTLIGVLGAVGVGFAAFGVTSLITVTRLTALVAAFTAVRTAIMGVVTGKAALLTLLGGSVGIILRVAAAIGAAIIGYKYFSQAVEKNMEENKTYTDNLKTHVETMEKIGSTHAGATKQVIQETKRRIEAMKIEMEALEKLQAKQRGEDTGKSVMAQWWDQTKTRVANTFGITTDRQKNAQNLNTMKSQVEEMESYIKRLDAIPKDPGQGTDPDGDKKKKKKDDIQRVTENIEEQIRKIQGLREQAIAMAEGPQEVKWAKAYAEAGEMLAKLPAGTDADKVLKKASENLRAAGFEGANIREQLTGALMAGDKLNEVIQEFQNTAKQIPEALKDADKKIKDIVDQVQEIEVHFQTKSVKFPEIPFIKNADGTFSTEQTITIEVDARYIVIPTIVGGKKISDAEAEELFKIGQNKPVGEFDTEDEAKRFAEARSAAKNVLFQPIDVTDPKELRDLRARTKAIQEFRAALEEKHVPAAQVEERVAKFTTAFDQREIQKERAEIAKELGSVLDKVDPVEKINKQYDRMVQVTQRAYEHKLIPTIEEMEEQKAQIQEARNIALVRGYETLSKRITDVVDDQSRNLRNKEERIDIARQTGAISVFERLRQRENVQAEAIAGMEQQARSLEALMNSASSPQAAAMLKQKLDDLNLTIEKLKANSNELTQMFDKLGESAAASFLEDWITGAKTFEQAWKDAINNLAKEITRLAAQDFASQFFGGGEGIGLGSILGPIFGARPRNKTGGGGASAEGGGGGGIIGNVLEWMGIRPKTPAVTAGMTAIDVEDAEMGAAMRGMEVAATAGGAFAGVESDPVMEAWWKKYGHLVIDESGAYGGTPKDPSMRMGRGGVGGVFGEAVNGILNFFGVGQKTSERTSSSSTAVAVPVVEGFVEKVAKTTTTAASACTCDGLSRITDIFNDNSRPVDVVESILDKSTIDMSSFDASSMFEEGDTSEVINTVYQTMDDFSSSIYDASQVLTEFNTAGSDSGSVFSQLYNSITDFSSSLMSTIGNIFSNMNLFGGESEGGGGGGLFGAIGNLFGGGGADVAASGLPDFDMSAAMSTMFPGFGGGGSGFGGGHPIVVGEHGREVWVPPTGGGSIIPYGSGGGLGMTVIQNFHVAAPQELATQNQVALRGFEGLSRARQKNG